MLGSVLIELDFKLTDFDLVINVSHLNLDLTAGIGFPG